MKTLYGKKWYKPKEIAELGLIQNSKGDQGKISGHYDFIIELIKSGRLKANNYSNGKRPYYLVSEDEINRYNEVSNEVK
jgi:hypothetical protein